MLQAFLKSTSSNNQSLPFKISYTTFYQLPFILSTSVARCLINVVYLTACAFICHDDVHFLNDVANDAESTQKSIISSYSLV